MRFYRLVWMLAVLAASFVATIDAPLAAGDINVGNDDVSVGGTLVNNYTFTPGTDGRLNVADGTEQFGSITLNRDADLWLTGQAGFTRTGEGITDTEFNLNSYQLTVSSENPEDPPLQQFKIGDMQIEPGATGSVLAGTGSIVARYHEVVLEKDLRDSSGSSVSIDANGISIACDNAHLPEGEFTVHNHVILHARDTYDINFICPDELTFFANVDQGGDGYEITYTGEFQFGEDARYFDEAGNDWGRAAEFSAPRRIPTDQDTVTYHVGENTFKYSDSLVVCGGVKRDGDGDEDEDEDEDEGDMVDVGDAVYGTVKIDSIEWLKNEEGEFLNLGFAGGKLDLSDIEASEFDFITNDVMIGSVRDDDHPGGGIFVLPNDSTLKLDAQNLKLSAGILEVEGDNLTVIVDCANSDLTPESFGGFKLPADATLNFINVEGDTVATGNLEGDGTVNAGGKNLALGSDADNTSAVPDEEKQFNGTIEGAAAVEKIGQGTTTFGTRARVTSDSATVSDGTLVINTDSFEVGGGSGLFTVEDGALGGTGSIGGDLMVGAGGTFQPGASIGTQTITGNLTVGGRTDIEVQPLTSDQSEGTPGDDNDLVHVTGSATFEPGATIAVEEDSDYSGGDPYKVGDRYYFLVSEADDVSGLDALRFTDDIPDFRVGDYGLTDSGTGKDGVSGTWLWFQLEAGTFYGTTPNTRATAAMLDHAVELGRATPLTSAIESLGPTEQTRALEQLAGESIGTSMATALQNTTLVTRMLSRRVRQEAGSEGGAAAPSTTAVAPEATTVRGQNTSGWCSPICREAADPIWTSWATGYGVGGTFHGDENTNRASVSVGGVLVGWERPWATNSKAGLFYAYGNAYTDVKNLHATAKTQDHLWGGYLGCEGMDHYLLLSGGLGYDHYEHRRQVFAGPFSEENNSTHGGWQSLVYSECGKRLIRGGTTLEPYFGLQYVYLRQRAFTEASTGFFSPLAVDAIDQSSFRTVLGTRLAHDLRVFSGGATAKFKAAWLHELLHDTAPIYTASLAVAPSTPRFTAAGADLARDWGWLGGGLEWSLGPYVTFGCDYDLMLNANQTLHTGSGTLAFAW